MSRVIFLVDMNAFYISCEATRNPQLAGRPAAVAGSPQRRAGIILAANYAAREFGVRTAMVVKEALKLCPQLELVPPDHDFYAEKSSQVMQLLSGYSPLVEQNSIDEAWLDMTGCAGLSGPPLVAAESIMRDIASQLGLICSIGIAENKFLAKMAADMKKPQGITWLKKEDIATRLWPLPVRALHGVGQKTAAKLRGLGVMTIGDLAAVDKDYLLARFGKNGSLLADHAQGIDNEPVTPRTKDDVKSISRMTTLPQDLTCLEQAGTYLLDLASDVGLTARNQDKKGQTVFITLKFNDFTQISRQQAVLPTNNTQDIYRTGCMLLHQHWTGQKPIRLIGIGLAGFVQDQAGEQISLFDLPGLDQNKDKLDQTMDQLRLKFGQSCLTYGKLLAQEKESNE